MAKIKYNKNQILYFFEAAFEYLITVLIGESYLATLTSYLGFSDSLTGILSSIISLGALFQLVSMLIHRKKMKGFVVLFSILNQLMFAFLYAVPIIPLPKTAKIIIFTVLIISAYFIYNVAHPKKIDWLMKSVDDGIRGRFTANKEMISLIIGMLFSFLMGNIVDSLKAQNNFTAAFVICGATIAVLMLGHTLVLLLSDEKEDAKVPQKINLKEQLKAVFTDKNIQKITFVFVLWSVAKSFSEPFNAIYMIKELGFSLAFISVLQIIQGIVRIIFSPVMGAYADKNGFAKMLKICFAFAFAGFAVTVFATPKNGAVIFTVHFILHGIAHAGIHSALINLVFDYVGPQKRADSLAVTQSVSGLFGFTATLLGAALLDKIQAAENTLFGISVYAQQVLSLIAAVLILLLMLFLQTSIINKNTKR